MVPASPACQGLLLVAGPLGNIIHEILVLRSSWVVIRGLVVHGTGIEESDIKDVKGEAPGFGRELDLRDRGY